MIDYGRVMREQKEELGGFSFDSLVRRPEEDSFDFASPLAQIVIGVRRCGKSTLCHAALHRAGIRYAYVNFDDEALRNATADDLNPLLEAAYVEYGDFTHIMLDEIQNVDGWHLFVNRLLRRKVRVVVTGSNAKMLSSELATHLTGRFHAIELLPFSFAEYRSWLGRGEATTTRTLAKCRRDFSAYFVRGGLPETFSMRDSRGYVKDLYDSILLRDILSRHSLRNPQMLLDVSEALLCNYSRETNYGALARTVGAGSVHTVQNYALFLRRAYLLFELTKYSRHPVRRVRNLKTYSVDPGFISHFRGVDSDGENLGWRLENIVFLELNRRSFRENFALHYWREESGEVDFVLVRRGKVECLVQVSWDVSSPRTLRRELDGFRAASSALGCRNLLLITAQGGAAISEEGLEIRHVAAHEWLLDDSPVLPPEAFPVL